MNAKLILCCLFAVAATEIKAESNFTVYEGSKMDKSMQEDIRLEFVDLVKKYGYEAETHFVTTEDGYILKVHRMPHGKKCGPKAEAKTPVLLVHGLFSHSVDWNLMGPEKGIGYILADECYDVWFANSRGCADSRAHKFLNIDTDEFWDFSWHEMGTKDLPALIDEILSITKQPKLQYIGHSQGTTQFAVMSSLLPHYNDKVSVAHFLAPVAYMKHLESPLIRTLLFFQQPFEMILKMVGIRDLLPTFFVLRAFGVELCREKYPLWTELCSNLMFLLGGIDKDQMNVTMIPMILGHTPAGGAVKQLLHYSQVIRSDEFKQYDYGILNNLKKYGTIKPPLYPLEKMKLPVAFYYSDNDYLANPEDVLDFAKKMPNLIDIYRVPLKEFTHLDFLWAIDVKTLLYDRLISNMKKF